MSLRSVIETISELGNGFLLALWIVAVSLLIWTRRKGNRTAAGKGDADSHGAEKAPDPVHCGKITLEALRNFDGRDPDKPLYVAIRGKVYDVTRGKDFYGPGCAYSCFTGRDASRALAKMSFTEEDLSGTADGLSAAETQILDDWEMKFQSKYTHVGTVIALRDA